MANALHRNRDAADEPDPVTTIRPPHLADGSRLYALAQQAGGLDLNSSYAYFLVASHFSASSALVEDAAGKALGFMSAYPFVTAQGQQHLFIWQVAVLKEARGQGLARAMLEDILARPALADICFVEGTVGPDNDASRRLFTGLAARRACPCEESLFLAGNQFPEPHADELLLRVGPMQ